MSMLTTILLPFSSPQSLFPAPNAVNTLAECWDRCDRAEQLQPYGCKGISWDPNRKACHYMILDTTDFGRGDVQLEGSSNRDLVSLVSAPCWRQRDYLACVRSNMAEATHNQAG